MSSNNLTKTADRYAILNVDALIRMIEEAQSIGYCDSERMYFALNDIISLLDESDKV